MIAPGFTFVYQAEAELGAAVPIGDTPDGASRMVPILSGRFAGPRLSGTLLPGGADWQVTRPDGVTVVDATYGLVTDDGTTIRIRNRGLRHGPAEVMAALARGDAVDPAGYYFRTVPEFAAPAGPHDWLNRSVFVGTGARFARSIRLWVWQVD